MKLSQRNPYPALAFLLLPLSYCCFLCLICAMAASSPVPPLSVTLHWPCPDIPLGQT
ncbi:hypothetical protein [Xenorhabdus bovienii]|uniref:hypothetical protein n=1 Tax=Xenorhabdus bovienii TaxID=40576 RepID=UPI003DA574D8